MKSILAKINDIAERISRQFNTVKPHYTPIGTLLCFSGITIPEGYLLCDGRTVSRTTYADLFNVIGTAYGTGDGSTTFNVPNFQNKTFWGGNSSSVGTVKDAGLPNITGDFIIRLHANANLAIWNTYGSFTSSTYNQSSQSIPKDATLQNMQQISFNASKSNSIYGKSTTVQPPAIVVQVIIKYI